jgi:hypothetical protein
MVVTGKREVQGHTEATESDGRKQRALEVAFHFGKKEGVPQGTFRMSGKQWTYGFKSDKE